MILLKQKMTMRRNGDRIREWSNARQRNTVWPDTGRNGILVDAFLWRGSAKATLIQRVGAGFFGCLFLISAATLIYLACTRWWLLALYSLFSGYVGARLLRNSLRKR